MGHDNQSNNRVGMSSEMTEKREQPPESQIRVLKGNPTDEEVAALLAVLASVESATESPQLERTRWGLAVDRLRYGTAEYQRLSVKQMTRMKR